MHADKNENPWSKKIHRPENKFASAFKTLLHVMFDCSLSCFYHKNSNCFSQWQESFPLNCIQGFKFHIFALLSENICVLFELCGVLKQFCWCDCTGVWHSRPNGNFTNPTVFLFGGMQTKKNNSRSRILPPPPKHTKLKKMPSSSADAQMTSTLTAYLSHMQP